MSQDYSGWSLSHLKSAVAAIDTQSLSDSAQYYRDGQQAMLETQADYSKAVRNLSEGWKGTAAGSAYDASMNNYMTMGDTKGNSDYSHSTTTDYDKSVAQHQQKVAAIEEPDTSVGGAISRSGGNPFSAASQYVEAQNQYKANQKQAAQQVSQMDSEGSDNADTMRSTAWQQPGSTTWATPDASLPAPPSRSAQPVGSGPRYNYTSGTHGSGVYSGGTSAPKPVHKPPTVGNGGSKPPKDPVMEGGNPPQAGGGHGTPVGPTGGGQTGTDPTGWEPTPPTVGANPGGPGGIEVGAPSGGGSSGEGTGAVLGGAGLLGAGALGSRGSLGGLRGLRGGSGGLAGEEGGLRGGAGPGEPGEGRFGSGSGGNGFGEEGRLPGGVRSGVGGVPEEGLGARPGSSLASSARGFGGEPISGEAGRPGGYPMGGGRGGRRNEDEEAPVPDYLVETEDIWGNGTAAAPAVIGE